jgi:hypothetical protein
MTLDNRIAVQLLQRDVACEDTSDYSSILYTFVDHLLFLALVTILFHTEIEDDQTDLLYQVES